MSNPWAEWDGDSPKERQPIEKAPKDGTLILIGDPDVGEFPMSWGHIQRNGLFPGQVGMWVMSGGEMTWNEDPEGGPTWWRHLEPPKRIPNGAIRQELALIGYGVIRQGSLWIVPNDAPDALIALVDDACERRNMDWAFIKDKLSLDEVKEAMNRRGRAE